MLFLPYRLDSKKIGFPIFTLLICLVCLFVYWNQYSKDSQHHIAVENFCHGSLDAREVSFLRNVARSKSGNPCSELFPIIRDAEDSEAKIQELTKKTRPLGIFASKEQEYDYIYNKLSDLYDSYDSKVPPNLTDDLVYDPKDLDIIKMVTATFSHGDIFHLMGNLLFFYIFSASIELVVGYLVYFLFIAVATIGTSLAYSFVMIGVEGALPTLGLSGVVMAAVAALGVMLPSVRIRCFFWFLIYFRVFKVPALFLALWYVGWDVYEMKVFGNDSYINYVAHVSGAFIGVLLGLYYLFFQKDVLNEAAVDY